MCDGLQCKNNEHNNMFYRVILEQLDIALHNKGIIADATKTKEIMTGLTGQLGFYMGLIPTGYVPVISGDQKSYMNNVLLKSQSRVTHDPGLSSLVSSATLSGHNIS